MDVVSSGKVVVVVASLSFPQVYSDNWISQIPYSLIDSKFPLLLESKNATPVILAVPVAGVGGGEGDAVVTGVVGGGDGGIVVDVVVGDEVLTTIV